MEKTIDKIVIKKIDAEAARRYPVNWRHTTPSERVAVFDDGLDSRSAFVAGAYFAISEIKSDEEKEKRIEYLEGLVGRMYDEFIRAAENTSPAVSESNWQRFKAKHKL